MPAKADTKAQRTFYEEKLSPLINKALESKITLLFIDAAHFVMGGDFLGYVYGLARRFVKTFSGRMRYNVLGALNFVTKKVTTVTNDTYITATEIVEMLGKIAMEYVGVPIHIVLDNARYQRCNIVTECAAKLGINLHFIPAYSPNLNLIERLWKHVRSKLLTRYYDIFDCFKNRIDSIINDTDKASKVEIDRLIGKSVQLFDDIVPINQNTYATNANAIAA